MQKNRNKETGGQDLDAVAAGPRLPQIRARMNEGNCIMGFRVGVKVIHIAQNKQWVVEKTISLRKRIHDSGDVNLSCFINVKKKS